MTTAISMLRTNLLNAIRLLLPELDVIEARTPDAWYAMNLRGGTAVVVSYAGKPKRREGPVGRRGVQGYVFRFSIAITGEDWASPAGATYEAADVAEELFGSPTLPVETPSLRTTSLGTIAGETVYLRFVDEQMQMAPNSTPEGGRMAIVQTWETDEVRI